MDRTLIANTTILDGSGAAPFPGDVLVEGQRIAAVQRGRRAAARGRAGHRRRRRHPDAGAHRAARPRELPRRGPQLGLHAPAARGARPGHDAQRADHARLRLHERAVGRLGQAPARHGDPQRDQGRSHPRPALPGQRPGDHGHRAGSATRTRCTCPISRRRPSPGWPTGPTRSGRSAGCWCARASICSS